MARWACSAGPGPWKPVIVQLEMASSVNPAAEAWNIVGEIRGREAPDEVIVVGGHLDSWDAGTGAVGVSLCGRQLRRGFPAQALIAGADMRIVKVARPILR